MLWHVALLGSQICIEYVQYERYLSKRIQLDFIYECSAYIKHI